jgi:capping protein beta
MTARTVTHCLNVLRRTPPSDVENNLERLIALRPDLDEELCQRVDTPLELETDSRTGQQFVLCDYNRDGDSYRSPWSNEYYPPIDDGDDGFKPSATLRELEKEANQTFDVYRHLYFEGGVSSVYMWDLDNGGFAACFCIQKNAQGSKEFAGFKGSWSSVHVFEVKPTGKKDTYNYRLTSTVLVSMPMKLKGLGDIDLSGSITKQAQRANTTLKSYTETSKQSHLEIMGPMLEDLELNLRSTIEGIYFQKTKEIINGMRVVDAAIKERDHKLAKIGSQAARKTPINKTFG